MADSCAKIAAGAVVNCDKQITAGVEGRLIVINKADIESVVYDTENDMIVKDIVLTSSPNARAYEFFGQNRSVSASWALAPQRYVKNFDHTVSFLIFDDGPTTRKTVASFANGNFVTIQINNYRGTDNKATYEIKGLDVGLENSATTADKNDVDSQGAPTITLATPADFKEPKPPRFFFDTDLTTTNSKIAALLV